MCMLLSPCIPSCHLVLLHLLLHPHHHGLVLIVALPLLYCKVGRMRGRREGKHCHIVRYGGWGRGRASSCCEVWRMRERRGRALLCHCCHVTVITFAIVAPLSPCHCIAVIVLLLLSCHHCCIIVVPLSLLSYHGVGRTRGKRRGRGRVSLPSLCCCHYCVIVIVVSLLSLCCHHHCIAIIAIVSWGGENKREEGREGVLSSESHHHHHIAVVAFTIIPLLLSHCHCCVAVVSWGGKNEGEEERKKERVIVNALLSCLLISRMLGTGREQQDKVADVDHDNRQRNTGRITMR